MHETILDLLPLIAILISGITLYLIFIKPDYGDLIEYELDLLKDNNRKKDKSISELEKNIKKQEDFIRKIKSTLEDKDKECLEKINELFLRWTVVGDSRINSIPDSNEAWYKAKLVVEQKPQIEWDGKNLSQSKSSFINGGNSYIEIEEEINQDFSEFSDEDFDNIIDEEETGSSSATDNNQTKKPKPKKKSNQMKM